MLKPKELLCTDILAREELYQDVTQRRLEQLNFSSTSTCRKKYFTSKKAYYWLWWKRQILNSWQFKLYKSSIQTSNFSWAELTGNSKLDRSKLWNVICKFRRTNDLRNVSNGWWQPAARTAKSNERMWWNFTPNPLIGVSCCLHVLQIIYIRQNVIKYSRISLILTYKQTVTCQCIRLPLNKQRT